MPLNQHGQYFSNPKHGEMADKNYDKHGQKSQEGHVEENGDGKPPVQIHKIPEGYKTVSDDGQGGVIEQDHPDIHTAMNHVMAHFGEAKEPASDALDDDDGPDGDNDADDQMDSGDVSRSDSGAF